jgi:peptidoglycan/xylan/chitin deacetylase (PgdA/CDA1 family)
MSWSEGRQGPLSPVRSALRRAGRALPSSLQVVLYHHVASEDGPLTKGLGVATPQALFEDHLRKLTRDYDVVGLDDVLAGRLPRRPLLITFDDGYRSVLDAAAPTLKRLGLPSVFFVSAAFVMPGSLPLDNLICWLVNTHGAAAVEQAVTGAPATGLSADRIIAGLAGLPYSRRARLPDELAERFGVDRARLRAESGLFLERDELARLRELGCEVANHSRSHLFCRTIVDDEVADRELVQHKHLLEEWAGAPVRAFSYPYGNPLDATPFVEGILAGSGHEATFLVASRPNGRRRAGGAWNRVGLDNQSLSRLGLQLEVLPRLRAVKDAVALR